MDHARTGRPSERADNATWRQGRDKRISRGTREAAELRNLPSSRPRDKFSLSPSALSSRRHLPDPPRARGVRNAGAKWLNSELTRRSEINVGLPACHSTRRSSALILLLHNNNRLISPALTSKREGEMRRSERAPLILDEVTSSLETQKKKEKGRAHPPGGWDWDGDTARFDNVRRLLGRLELETRY